MGLIVYTSTTCPRCHALKAQFAEHGVAFIEKNIDVNEDFKVELLMLGRCTVPTVVKDGVVQAEDAESSAAMTI